MFSETEIKQQERTRDDLNAAILLARAKYVSLLDEARNVMAKIHAAEIELGEASMKLNLMRKGSPTAGQFFIAVCSTGRCQFGHRKTDPRFNSKDEAKAHALTHQKPKRPHVLKIRKVISWH